MKCGKEPFVAAQLFQFVNPEHCQRYLDLTVQIGNKSVTGLIQLLIETNLLYLKGILKLILFVVGTFMRANLSQTNYSHKINLCHFIWIVFQIRKALTLS